MNVIEHDIEKEYRDFVYAVSHDFQAPLRHIQSFSQFLIESRGNPSEEEQSYIDYINDATHNLQVMQDALLTLSRIKIDPENQTTHDCNKLVSGIIKLQQPDPGTDVYNFDIKTLPTITGDADWFEFIFVQLIDNAIKFHTHDANNKTIKISAFLQNDYWVFSIQDNGIGIKEQYKDDIFKIFRRLAPNDYPGIGAGLTITRKIVRLHGGDIWLDTDQDGKGTLVKFSLPQK